MAIGIGVPKNRLYAIIISSGMTANLSATGFILWHRSHLWLSLQKPYELDVARQKIEISLKP